MSERGRPGYDSATSGDRYSKGRRLAHRIWPNGRKIHSVYDGHNGIDDATSRVNKLAEDNGGIPGTTIAQYQFLGDGRAVRKEYPTPQVRLDLWGGTSGSYAGLDRFGRTIDHKWASYGGSDLDRFQHGYDNVSNRLYRDNTLTADKDELYTYDNWHRLRSADRGQLSGGTITNPVREEDWTLNPLGNWDGYDTKANGATDLSQTRSHSNANEITAITTSVGTAWATPPVHDLAGNMTTMPSGLDPTVALTASYDAWNRMIELRLASDNSLVGSYGYDGQGRRISKTTLSPNETRHYYYSNQWQIVEERVGTSTTADRQYVHGLQYVDELCLRGRDTNADGILDEHLYSLQDANWNVTAIVNPGGTVTERYQYDPYGKRTIMDGSWSVIASSGYDWNTGHQGLYLDGEGGLYHNRARALHPTLGRFVQRDPLGYVDGMSSYQYVRSTPILWLDPQGTKGCNERRCMPPVIGPNRYNLRPARMAVTMAGVSPPRQAAPANWAKASFQIDKYLDVGKLMLAGAKGFYRAYDHGTLRGSCRALAEEAEEQLYEDWWKKNAQGHDPDLVESSLNNLFQAFQGRDGFSVWIGVEYDECVACSRGFWEWLVGCCPANHMEKSENLFWVQCTEGTASFNDLPHSERGVYGGQAGHPTPTAANIGACAARALAEASK